MAGPDEGLLESNFAELNERFYDARPWTYFQHRLGHLAMVASGDRGLHDALERGVTLGAVEIATPAIEAGDSDGPTAAQAFAAVEAEVLLHHCAETLLRFVHAHAEGSPCPWLRMSRVRGPGEFKDWVREEVVKVPDPARAALCGRVFALSGSESRAACGEYLELLADHFLQPDSYNAAKHGMALSGGAAQLNLTVAQRDILSESGATVGWLAPWPRDNGELPRCWTRHERFMSIEAMVALIAVSTYLMQSLWVQARHLYLGEDLDRGYRPPAPASLFAAMDLRHPVIADVLEPLRYEGVSGSVVVRSRNFTPPGEVPDSGA